MTYDHNPTSKIIDVKGLGFGSAYQGKHRVWTFEFRPDRTGGFAQGDDHVALLQRDLDKVPVILNLTETINTVQAVFDLNDKSFTNTVVKAL